MFVSMQSIEDGSHRSKIYEVDRPRTEKRSGCCGSGRARANQGASLWPSLAPNQQNQQNQHRDRDEQCREELFERLRVIIYECRKKNRDIDEPVPQSRTVAGARLERGRRKA